MNTIKTLDGIEVYEHELFRLADEFEYQTQNKDSIGKPAWITGLLDHIYVSLFKPISKRQHGETSSLDYEDIESLDRLFHWFVTLMARYSVTPSMLDFATMTGISRQTFFEWREGITRGKSAEHGRTAKRWYTLCESSLARKATEQNGIGAIFALKACYQWKEADAQKIAYIPATQLQSAEQIQQKYQELMPAADDLESVDSVLGDL